ncbi:MAG TPA: SRPBCC domain-containing protein [Armatimonadota bacterium]
MATLYHQVGIRTSRQKLYDAITTEQGISRWWDKPTLVDNAEGLVLEFNPGPEHGTLRMKVLETVDGKRVAWQCISTHPESSPAFAWTGTHIIFEITEKDDMAVLNFYHTGWDEHSEYLGFCNFGWGQALSKLKQYCEGS